MVCRRLSRYFVKLAILVGDTLCAIKNAYTKRFLGETVLLVFELI